MSGTQQDPTPDPTPDPPVPEPQPDPPPVDPNPPAASAAHGRIHVIAPGEVLIDGRSG